MNYLYKILLSLCLISGLIACQSPQGPMTAEQKEAIRDEVRPAVADLVKSLEERDLKRAISHFSLEEDAAFVVEGQIHSVSTLQGIEDERWSDVAEQHFDFADPKVTVLSSDAIVGTVEGTHSAVDTAGAPFGGPIAWTMVWVKENGTWKLRHGHFSEPLVMAVGTW